MRDLGPPVCYNTEVYSHRMQYSIRQNRIQKTRLEMQVKNLHEPTENTSVIQLKAEGKQRKLQTWRNGIRTIFPIISYYLRA